MKLRQPGKDASKELRLIIPHNFFIELSDISITYSYEETYLLYIQVKKKKE